MKPLGGRTADRLAMKLFSHVDSLMNGKGFRSSAFHRIVKY